MKKLLALVLALVMTLSLCVTSNAAFAGEEYDYDEAVEVMAAVGVFQGDENGKFNGKAELTREQAAKLIAYLDLGEKVAEALPAVKVFNDVAADRWSAKYVAYCADAGYINGVGDGNFDPAGKLTGYAFGKMLLCVLGYDAKIEGFTGAAWTIKVAKLMESNDINDNVDASASAVLTREQAAQYCLNALLATMVEYADKGTSVTVNGAEIVASAKAANKVVNNAKKETINDDDFKQLGEKLYGTDLVLKVSGTDDLKRPANEWEYKKDSVGAYAQEADYTLVLDKTYSFKGKAAIVKELKELTDNDDLTLPGKLFFNSVEKTVDEAKALFAKGMIVELFCNDDDQITTLVALKPELAQIKSVSTKLTASETKDGASYKITLVGGGTFYDDSKTAAKVLAGFDAETYVKDAYVVVFADGGQVLASYLATEVVGKVSSYKTNDYVVIDGTKYKAINGLTFDSLKFNDEYTIYTTAEGYLLKVDGAKDTTIDDVYYVTGVYMTKATKGVTKYYAETVSLDGVVADFEMAKTDALVTGLGNFDKFTKTGAGLYTMTTDDDGKYLATEYTGDDDYAVKTEATYAVDVKADASKMTVDSQKVYLTSDTAFVSVKVDASEGYQKSVKFAEGGMSYAGANKATAVVIYDKDTKDAAYVLYAGSAMSTAANTNEVVFVVDASSAKVGYGDKKTGYSTEVYFMDGNKSETIVTDSNYGTGFYTYAVNDDGAYELKGLDKFPGKFGDSDDGWANVAFKKAAIHNDTVSFTKNEDVDFSEALVIDLRDEDDVDAGKYTYDYVISDIADLKDAADDTTVKTFVYVIDGDITFIAVKDGANKPN